MTPVYAETELPVTDGETDQDEDNPVVEVTEHGIEITKSCAVAIEKKLYVPASDQVTVINDGTLVIGANCSIEEWLPYEFKAIKYVEFVEAYNIPGGFGSLFIVHLDPSLSIREKAALFAEDERVTSLEPNYGIPVDEIEMPELINFEDDNVNAYYHNALAWACTESIAKGYSGNVFGVGKTCSRKDFLIFLWRTLGKPEPVEIIPCFDDMTGYNHNSDTYNAIIWALNHGIVKGYKDGTFRPDEPVKRKDALIMMYRAEKNVSSNSEIAFPDVLALGYPSDSDTYRAIAWATEYEITKGYKDGSFRPLENCLREQAITFLYRWKMR
jgi:hypothetical protein